MRLDPILYHAWSSKRQIHLASWKNSLASNSPAYCHQWAYAAYPLAPAALMAVAHIIMGDDLSRLIGRRIRYSPFIG
jgi:hypothetical protein